MRGQPWPVAMLIAMMCLVRFGLAAYGYAMPVALMEQLAAAASDNVQMPYIIRVWAIRDMALAVLVVTARPGTIKPLLIACIVVDASDMLSAWLGHRAGLFTYDDMLSLMTTAVAALVPEILALALITRSRRT